MKIFEKCHRIRQFKCNKSAVRWSLLASSDMVRRSVAHTKKNLFSMNTISKRINDIGKSIENKLEEKVRSFKYYSLAIDDKLYLPKETYPVLHHHALLMFSLFSSTYICEQLFSRMKNTKSKNRSTISDEHLESCLRVFTTSIDPDIDSLLSQKKQFQISH
ncbi:HAT, C-terminal dimerisation domain [Cinara cedri]|uniref:HAT, C-terminal dimerisation domain n=1 Tax=Cinara cedri TaxID=506608 RepID=A0A5E4MQW2_9HEMI|nr:HAT, C-terminal dimerisation domain [Cinara cedri]